MGDYKVGYARPPIATRFKKGRSGNPRGRPKGGKNSIPYDTVLGQFVTVVEDGVERRITAAEAFLLHLAKKGLEGDAGAATKTLGAIEAARDKNILTADEQTVATFILIGGRNSVGTSLEALRIGTVQRRHTPQEKLKLQPWVVDRALERRGERPFSIEEQKKIYEATRTPHKVNWPDWWAYNPRS